MSNQGLRQASVRGSTSTLWDYNGDWHALFTADGIADGSFDERMLAWCNAKLGTSHTNVTEAKQAFAEDQGFYNWNSMGTFQVAVPISLGATVWWDLSDASTVTTTGDDIDQVDDKTGNGNHAVYATSTPATYTGLINGLNAYEGPAAGNSNNRVTPFTIPAAATVFIVVRPEADNAGGPTGAGNVFDNTGFGIQFQGGGIIEGGLADGTATTYFFGGDRHTYSVFETVVLAFRWDGTDMAYWKGATKITKAHGLTLSDQTEELQLGAMLENGGVPFTQLIGEAFFVPSALSDANVEKGVNYLAGRWMRTLFSAAYDGSTDLIKRGADFTGNSDGTEFTCSFWVNFNGGDGVTQYVYHAQNSRVLIQKNTSNQIRARIQTATATTLVDALTTTTQTAADDWAHYLVVANGTSLKIYKDGVDVTNQTVAVAGTYSLTRSDHAVGAQTTGADKLNGQIADVWLHNTAIDDVSKFYNAGNPVFLGYDGSNPGVQPLLFCDLVTGTNAGTGGNMTVSGTPVWVAGP